MIPWYSPTTFRYWCVRQVSLRAVALGLVLAGFTITEFRFHWIERAMGYYLVTTNSARPELGAIWDQGHQAHLARQTLESYMAQRRATQREARRAASLGQVISGLGSDSQGGAMLSAEHFVELYLQLPPVLSNELISSYTLLAYLSGGHWQRTFFERQDKQLLIYLLDENNQVLHNLIIGAGLLGHLRRGEVAIDAGLEQLADLGAHIYPAEKFFNVLNTFPEAVRKGIVAHPEDLLRVSGRIVRVGIADASAADVVELGFEVEGIDGLKVLLMQGRQEDVQRLLWTLEGRTGFGWPEWGGGRQ